MHHAMIICLFTLSPFARLSSIRDEIVISVIRLKRKRKTKKETQ